uniref:Cytochrome P450 n=1 Tax=Glossina palpalis gambiensis TaxID=67801 RepID=A0A1B0BXJ5_9MUSC
MRLNAMKYRKMLMEARVMLKSDNLKSHNREWSDIDIVGQCFLFFFAGFETAASLICLITHAVIKNPDVQEKLLREIQDVNRNLDCEPYSYMDMVVSETLSEWSVAPAVDRVCTDDKTYELKTGQKLEIGKVGKGKRLFGYQLKHRDSQCYENPNKFDPERFSEENKDNIRPFTHLPFGLGPRNCIGSRFALLETKVLIYYLLRDFHLAAAKKSSIPLKPDTNGFQLLPKKGFWLKFISRN